MADPTPTLTQPKTGVSSSHIVEDIVVELQATHEEEIASQGEGQKGPTEAEPLVSYTLRF